MINHVYIVISILIYPVRYVLIIGAIIGKKFLKPHRINLRLNPSDIVLAKERAMKEGIPYQTLIASIIHKYLTGQLLDKYTVQNIFQKKSIA